MSHPSVMLQAIVDCPQCRRPTPMFRLGESHRCAHCGATSATRDDFHRRVLEDAIRQSVVMPKGKGRRARIRTRPAVRLLFGRMEAHCPAPCRAPYPVPGLIEAARDGRDRLFCPACGRPVQVRPAPAWLVALRPDATMVIGEQDPGGSSDTRIFLLLAGALAEAQSDPDSNAEAAPSDGPTSAPSAVVAEERPAPPNSMMAPKGLEVTSTPVDEGGAPTAASHGELVDIAVMPAGRLATLWRTAGGGSRVGTLDLDGRLGLCDLPAHVTASTRLFTSPHTGQLLLCDAETGRIGPLPLPARSNGQIVTPPSEGQPPTRRPASRPTSVSLARGGAPGANRSAYQQITVDMDGTFVLAMPDDRSAAHARASSVLCRADDRGEPLALWEPSEGRVAGALPRSSATERIGAFDPMDDAAATGSGIPSPMLDELGPRPRCFPSGAIIAVGWNRLLHIAHPETGAIARFDRDGTPKGVITVAQGLLSGMLSIAATRDGTVYVLGVDAVALGGRKYLHVATVDPTGRTSLWLGPRASCGGLALGAIGSGEPMPNMSVWPDGAVAFGAGTSEICIVAADGAISFMTPGWLARERRLRSLLGDSLRHAPLYAVA